LIELYQISVEEKDEKLLKEIEDKSLEIERELYRLESFLLLSGKYDDYDAILSIHAGTGGVEACDWAAMLLEMYLNFAKKYNYKVKIIDRLVAKEAGIKNATLEIKDSFAYGLLKAERGVHRLVRISPFDADKARHTSFALVEVMPEIKRDNEILIKPEELKIETFRSSGPGGQHANVTASAVRITHLPTGITTSSQNERSQFRNKEEALKVLKSRLLEEKIKKEERKINQLRGENIEASWGNQIRSYILHPYQLVKDHRTGYESKDVNGILKGELMPFLWAYLRYIKKQSKR